MKTYFFIIFLVSMKLYSGVWIDVSPPSQSITFYGVHFTDNNNGVAVGWDNSNSGIYITTNGGQTWTLKNPGSSYLFGVNTNGYNNIFVSGYSGIFNCGLLFKTSDRGTNWNNVIFDGNEAPVCFGFYNYIIVDNLTHFMSGYQGMIVKSTDGGNSWRKTNTMNGTDVFRSLCFADKNIGFACGGANGNFQIIDDIFKTTDGGDNWVQIVPHGSGYSIGSIKFVNPLVGFIIGYYQGQEAILKTVDGGISWNPVYKGISSNVLQGGCVIGDSIIYAAGQSKVIRSTDQGGTWSEEQILNNQLFMDIDYPSKDIGYAVGSGGTILKYIGSTSVEDAEIESQFAIEPNPANDFINIKLNNNLLIISNEKVFVNIYNEIGLLVFSGKYFIPTITIDTKPFPDGIYFCVINSENKIEKSKFIIKR